jgi:hypothetical protein
LSYLPGDQEQGGDGLLERLELLAAGVVEEVPSRRPVELTIAKVTAGRVSDHRDN